MIRSLETVIHKARAMVRSSAARRVRTRLAPAVEFLEDRALTSYVPTGTPGDVTNVLGGGQTESSTRTVAEMANGDYRVVWEDHGVYTRLFGPDGKPLGAPVLLDGNAADSEATVAINDSGAYVIAFTTVDSFTNREVVQVFAYNAKGLRKESLEFTLDPGDVHQPAVAIDSAGEFVVATTLSNSNGTSSISLSMDNVTHDSLQDITYLTSERSSQPSLAMTPSGSFVLAWAARDQSGEEIMAQRFNAKGVAQSAPITVSTSTLAEAQPSVAVDTKGDFVVAYTQIWNQVPVNDGLIHTVNDQTIVSAALFKANGSPIGTSFAVAGGLAVTASAYDPSAAMDAKGNFVIGYTLGGSYGSYVPGDGIPAVHASAYNSTGTLQQGAINLAADGNSYDYHTSVALSTTGHLAAVWENYGTKLQGDVSGTGVFTQTFKNLAVVFHPGFNPDLLALDFTVGQPGNGKALGQDAALIGLLMQLDVMNA
jgi:hypothetical protein